MSFDGFDPRDSAVRSDGTPDAAGAASGPPASETGAREVIQAEVERGVADLTEVAAGDARRPGSVENFDVIAGESADIEIKPHYVYMLVDPRDDEVFYVGKGQNGRLKDHERAARNDPSESAKDARIRTIHAADKEVKARVIGRFGTEAEAFAVEAVLIHWMYGRRGEEGGQLTNIQAGHGHRYIRRRGDLAEQPPIDVQARMPLEPGTYSRKALQKLLGNRIPDIALEVLDRVREGLARRGIALQFDAPRVVESGRWIASVATLQQDVTMRLQFSSQGLITNLRAAAEGTKAGKNAFTQAVVQRDLRPMKEGNYTWLDGWCNSRLKFDDTEAILDRIQAAFELFRPRQTSPAAATPN